MKTPTFKKNFNISFVLRTEKNNTLLMLLKETSQIIFRINDGKIEVQFLDGAEDTRIMSSYSTITDNFYHVVELNKERKAITLKIDGNVQQTERYNDEIRNPTIYLGGYPAWGELSKFSGEIKDIIIDNE